MQEYLYSAHISNSSIMEMSGLSRSRSAVNLVEHAHRRLVTAASQHIVHGKATQLESETTLWPSLKTRLDLPNIKA